VFFTTFQTVRDTVERKASVGHRWPFRLLFRCPPCLLCRASLSWFCIDSPGFLPGPCSLRAFPRAATGPLYLSGTSAWPFPVKTPQTRGHCPLTGYSLTTILLSTCTPPPFQFCEFEGSLGTLDGWSNQSEGLVNPENLPPWKRDRRRTSVIPQTMLSAKMF